MFPLPIVRSVLTVALGLALVAHSGGASAEYALPEIELVPVERIVANLERQAQQLGDAPKATDYARIRAQIARVYALAYAQGAARLQVDAESGVLFEGPGWVPAIPQPADNASADRAPEWYLRMAGLHYAAVTIIDTTDMRSRLGHAWVFERQGNTVAAIDLYREVLVTSWPEDKDIESLEYGARPLSQEAALRLIDLLDPQEDAAEISELQRRSAQLDNIGRWITPIVIPLEDEVEFESLIDPTAAVTFDLDGAGRDSRWRWITPRAAWLVWDPTGEGRIESGLQLFGSVTFWLFWENGYDALASLDDDGDGQVAGPERQGLALWRDADGDGRSDPGEVRPLEDWGVVALSTARSTHPLGFPYNPEGVILEDGRRRASYDWILPAVPTEVSARP